MSRELIERLRRHAACLFPGGLFREAADALEARSCEFEALRAARASLKSKLEAAERELESTKSLLEVERGRNSWNGVTPEDQAVLDAAEDVIRYFNFDGTVVGMTARVPRMTRLIQAIDARRAARAPKPRYYVTGCNIPSLGAFWNVSDRHERGRCLGDCKDRADAERIAAALNAADKPSC